jgi:hypothetical protein
MQAGIRSSTAKVRKALLTTMAGMPSRVIAFFLALVLLWSGIGAIETPRTQLPFSHEQQHAIAHSSSLGHGSGTAHEEGSVDHHHLDDLPTQALSDPPVEPPGLPSEPMVPSFHTGPVDAPRSRPATAMPPPFLTGLLRPPCCNALAG